MFARMLLTNLLTLRDLYCSQTGRSSARVATIIFNQGSKFDQISKGGDLYTRRYEAAVEWFAENWPDDLAWPDNIERPELAHAEAAQ